MKIIIPIFFSCYYPSPPLFLDHWRSRVCLPSFAYYWRLHPRTILPRKSTMLLIISIYFKKGNVYSCGLLCPTSSFFKHLDWGVSWFNFACSFTSGCYTLSYWGWIMALSYIPFKFTIIFILGVAFF